MQSPQEQRRELLSAQQVQLMLDVDRSTIYRMAEDGRLPAIKVGRQWRFPADRMAALLRVAGDDPGNPGLRTPVRPAPGRPAPDGAVAAAVAQVAAELLGVMMVVTDMDGRPLTAVCNPCPWFTERSGDPGLLESCIAEWQQYADDPDFGPRFQLGVLGFECARAFVRSGMSLAGMVLAGGVAPAGPGSAGSGSAGSGSAGLYVLDGAERRRVIAALPKVAAVLSRVPPRSAG